MYTSVVAPPPDVNALNPITLAFRYDVVTGADCIFPLLKNLFFHSHIVGSY